LRIYIYIYRANPLVKYQLNELRNLLVTHPVRKTQLPNFGGVTRRLSIAKTLISGIGSPNSID